MTAIMLMLGSTIAQAATTPNYYFLPTAAKVVVKGNSSKNELEYIPPAGTPKYWTFNFTLPKAEIVFFTFFAP